MATAPRPSERAALRAHLEALAAPFVEALRAATARVQGADRREQSWDSYDYRGHQSEEWGVTVPFATLPLAQRAVVPVAAAERILALPDVDPSQLKPWERPPPGRAYRRYWAENKRFLTLVADIAARFVNDGGERLAKELRGRLRRLSPRDRRAVSLHLATLGLLDQDPVPLARSVLGAADAEDLGTRGELVLGALRSLDAVPEGQRAELLAEVGRVARRTTAFVASNPFAAAVEALAQAEVADLADMVELVDRALRLKISYWDGWQRALQAASRALTHLVRRDGASLVDAAVSALRTYAAAFPTLETICLLAGARGLPEPENIALAQRALMTARHLPVSTEALRAEAEAIELLAELGAEGARGEIETLADRIHQKARGRAKQVGRQVAAGLCARLNEHGDLLARGLLLADPITDAECRWLAYLGLATAKSTPPDAAAACGDQVSRAARRWLLRRPPFDLLVPLVGQLAARVPTAYRHPALAGLAELAIGADSGTLGGQRFAAAMVSLGPRLTEPPAQDALVATIAEIGVTWWRLPLLALLADGTAAWLEALVEQQVAVGSSATAVPRTPKSPA